MARYNVFFKASVEKDLKNIPQRDLARILEKIASLQLDPRPVGCEKLTGQDRYRIRHGNHRIVYSIQDHELTVWVVKVGHRREI